MSNRTRTVSETEVQAWWDAGWQLVGIDENGDCIMRWDGHKAPVQPLKDEEFEVVAGAVAALEGRAG